MSSSKKIKRRLNLKNIFIILIVIASISLSTYYILNLRIKHILILGTTNIKDVGLGRLLCIEEINGEYKVTSVGATGL